VLECCIDPKPITPLLHLSTTPLPSPSRHLVSQLLRDFDRESRLGDLFERDFAIDEAALGLDRTNDVADAFLRRNTGVIEARLKRRYKYPQRFACPFLGPG
jgi:hypothetical protein